MIYTRETAYNKLHNYKKALQITKQLHIKLKQRLQGIPSALQNYINDQINMVIPQTIYDMPIHRELNEDIFDFMNLYNTPHKQNSTTTTETAQHNQHTIENLRILSKNVGGKLQNKIDTESNLTLEILMYQPHVIAIQEHQLNILTRSAFTKAMDIPGYTLITHHKAELTRGRPSGGLALWIYTPLLNTYTAETTTNTHETQIVTLRPKTTYHQHPLIQITNVYYTPALTELEYIEHSNQALKPAKNHNTIAITVGDLNARSHTTGDNDPNDRGKILCKQCTLNQQMILNTTLAYGQPTNQTKKNTLSVVDLAIVPKHQQHIWSKIIIGDRELNPVVHNTLIVDSTLPIPIEKTPPEYHYTINYNPADQYCLRKFIENITGPALANILRQVQEYLDTENIEIMTPEQILPTIQDIHCALHHITALQVFGIKKQQHTQRNQHRNWENHEEIQDILYNTTMSQQEKTQQLAATIHKLNHIKMGKRKATQQYEDTTAMFKKYRRNQQANKVEYPDTIKTEDGTSHAVEIGYSKYLSNRLMKAISIPVPEIQINQHIPNDQEETANPINLQNIRTTIHDLNKDKSPGLSGIPVNYYQWGGEPMIQMVYTWYNTMKTYNYVPWNLKIDIKIPFPKYSNDAKRVTKQDPAQYRPIALQNSMYKILDGCIKLSLEKHDTTYQIIHKNQGGFKKKEGTTEHLYIAQNMFSYNKHLYCAFLDLQKAYDSVWREALFKKLEKQYKVPPQTTKLLQAMYDNTWSCTRIKSTLSPIYKTYNGLQQGALSSPILFNYYINDLITQLNKVNAGTHVGNLHINNLLFADDIMLMANSKTKLQQLLNICSDWANTWQLKFSPSKSKTLTNQHTMIGKLKLQGKDILETEIKIYKYLGIPFTKTGIDVETYFEYIKRKMQITLHNMATYCDRHQINYNGFPVLSRSLIFI